MDMGMNMDMEHGVGMWVRCERASVPQVCMSAAIHIRPRRMDTSASPWRRSAVWCSAAQCSAVQCCAVLCNAVYNVRAAVLCVCAMRCVCVRNASERPVKARHSVAGGAGVHHQRAAC
mmetsp:Transcript_20496/g.45730  ORF Transcript_20496/g.45730 Transcript_20496/m.45730 type:complete len:118 (-) Transcript_20496:417-770(-)